MCEYIFSWRPDEKLYLHLDYRKVIFLKPQLLDACTLRRGPQLRTMQTGVLKRWSQAPVFSESCQTFLLWPRKQQIRKVFKTKQDSPAFLYFWKKKNKNSFGSILERLILVSISYLTMCWAVTSFLGRVQLPRYEVFTVPSLRKYFEFHMGFTIARAHCLQYLVCSKLFYNKTFASMTCQNKSTSHHYEQHMWCPAYNPIQNKWLRWHYLSRYSNNRQLCCNIETEALGVVRVCKKVGTWRVVWQLTII